MMEPKVEIFEKVFGKIKLNKLYITQKSMNCGDRWEINVHIKLNQRLKHNQIIMKNKN